MLAAILSVSITVDSCNNQVGQDKRSRDSEKRNEIYEIGCDQKLSMTNQKYRIKGLRSRLIVQTHWEGGGDLTFFCYFFKLLFLYHFNFIFLLCTFYFILYYFDC